MDTARDQFIDGIESHLTKLACDVILDPAPAAVGAAVEALAIALEAGHADEVAVRVRQLPVADVTALAPACQALWRNWIGEDEVRRDIEALAADAELSGMFVAEALDHLSTIEATLLRLEDTPDDKTLLNDVFRPFHTIKGNAGALGVSTVQALAHKVENLLDRCRSGQHRVGSAEVDAVLKAVDLITAMLNDLSARIAGKPGTPLRDDRIALVATVERLIAGGSDEPAPRPPADSIPLAATESLPLAAADAGEPADARHADAPRRAGEPKRAAAVRTDAVENQASVKVDTRKLDGLVDTVGELVILQSLIYEDPALKGVSDERFTRNLAQLRRITTELQRGAMSMRMVPIRQTFQKMARLVRDLSKRSGKPVELTLAGEDTELDRKVVEDINDPLMHMVRNSMDHGLEPRDRRLAAGKREVGQLSLRAFHQGGSIVIEIADDGAGLNTERIVAKAVANGLIASGDTLSPSEIHQLIFAPGFSTAEQVTEISGRGVGMDVVKRNIEALRGRIEIETAAGKGTTFSIKLPLTMAILDGLLVQVAAERFVIPTFAIRESLRPLPSQVHTLNGVPRLIQVRDELLPLVWLSDLFRLEAMVKDAAEGTVVVLEEAGRRIGVVVDALIGKQEVVVKSLGAAFAGVRGVAGGAILGDGRIGLILDAHGIVKLMHEDSQAA
jgi:two-component system chemotaxis sensor kinase CheA